MLGRKGCYFEICVDNMRLFKFVHGFLVRERHVEKIRFLRICLAMLKLPDGHKRCRFRVASRTPFSLPDSVFVCERVVFLRGGSATKIPDTCELFGEVLHRIIDTGPSSLMT